MDPYPNSEEFRELRIIVLHNQDFIPGDHTPNLHDHTARADVAHVAQDVARALVARGHFVEIKAIDTEDLPDLLKELQEDPPDLVFNLCESLGGDDRNEGVIPSLLELLKIPYTGSNALSLGLCLRKERTQDTLRSFGIPIPLFALLGEEPSEDEEILQVIRYHQLSYPFIVKPTRENASVGIHENSVVYTDEELIKQVKRMRTEYKQPLLVEEFIQGREINVSFLGNNPSRILPLYEIDFSTLPDHFPHIVSYQGKWDKQSIAYQGTQPKPVSDMEEELYHKIEMLALHAFDALELVDYGRCDIRISKEGNPYVIDINPNCDLSKEAGFAKAAHQAGLSYEQTIEQIAIFALKRSRNVSYKRSQLSLFHSFRAEIGSAQTENASFSRSITRGIFTGRSGLRLGTHQSSAL